MIGYVLRCYDKACSQAVERCIKGRSMGRLARQHVGNRLEGCVRPRGSRRQELYGVGEIIERGYEAIEQLHLGRCGVMVSFYLMKRVGSSFEPVLHDLVLPLCLSHVFPRSMEGCFSRFHPLCSVLRMGLVLLLFFTERLGLLTRSCLLLPQKVEPVSQPVEVAVIGGAFLGDLLFATTKIVQGLPSCFRNSTGLIACCLGFLKHTARLGLQGFCLRQGSG